MVFMTFLLLFFCGFWVFLALLGVLLLGVLLLAALLLGILFLFCGGLSSVLISLIL